MAGFQPFQLRVNPHSNGLHSLLIHFTPLGFSFCAKKGSS
jgi:hypothetical protein